MAEAQRGHPTKFIPESPERFPIKNILLLRFSSNQIVSEEILTRWDYSNKDSFVAVAEESISYTFLEST